MNSRTRNQGKAMPRIKQGGRDAIIAANEHRKEVLKQFDRNIMAAIRALGGTATFYDVHRAALAAENMLRTYQTVDAAFNAMMHDPSPLRIRPDAVRRNWVERLWARIRTENTPKHVGKLFLRKKHRAELLRSLLRACQARMHAEEQLDISAYYEDTVEDVQVQQAVNS